MSLDSESLVCSFFPANLPFHLYLLSMNIFLLLNDRRVAFKELYVLKVWYPARFIKVLIPKVMVLGGGPFGR